MENANISGIGRTFAQGKSVRVNSDMREEDEKINFLDVMNQMAVQPQDELFAQDKNDAGISLDKTSSSTGDYDRYRHHENTVKTRENVERTVDKASIFEQLSKYAGDVKEVLKEELGVTDEQLEEVMEAMGITAMDLMNPNLLAEFAVRLTGCENISELLCNSGFMTVMQTVQELTEQLLAELGVSLEELTQMMQAAEEIPEMDLDGNAKDAVEQMPQENDWMNPTEELPEEAVSLTTEEQGDADNSGESSVMKKTGETVEETQNVEEGMKMAAPESEKETFKGGHSSENGQMHESAGQGAVNQNLTDTVPVQGAEAKTEFAGQVDVSDIIKQIAEFSRITVQNAATTMEMQLNPEHLGKIYLEITSKAGNVSAHITAQNEIVKEALESQIVELKENMNQAGVKIDAVEVTVGSHEFEKNLERDAKQEEQQAEEQEKAAKQTRHINLNDLDELNGFMTEEETLVAQMMAEQGNSVDYTA